MIEAIRKEIRRILPEVIAMRHALHADPELSLVEHRTQQAVREALSALPLSFRDPVLETDVVADLDVGASETVLLRADMDALPVVEETGASYQSRNAGVAHACGHDGHTALLVGAARVLCACRDALPCNVRFVFQPGEEGRCAGRDMVERGAADGTACAYALHAWPGVPAGSIGCRPGVLMAAGCFFEATFQGVGCHGAMPENGRNPIPVAADATVRIAREHERVNREMGAVISVCAIQGGATTNVIPESATLKGTFRFLDERQGAELNDTVRGACEAAAAGTGVTVSWSLNARYDAPVVNNSAETDRLRTLVEGHVGADRYVAVAKPSMGTEDFAFFLRERPGLMFWLGMGENSPTLHSPRFDFNDAAAETGILTLCLLAAERAG